MRAFYDAWWAELEPTFAQTTEIHLGHPDHPVVSLTGHDWIQEALAAVEPAAHPRSQWQSGLGGQDVKRESIRAIGL